MITPANSFKIFEKEFLSVKLNNFNVLNSTYVKVADDTIISQGYLQRRRQEHPREPKW